MGDAAEDAKAVQALRIRREASGMTQGQAAKAIGVDPVTLSRWERGVQPIKDRDLQALLRLYNRSVHEANPPAYGSRTNGRDLLLRNAVRRLRALLEEIEDLILTPVDDADIPAATSVVEPEEFEPTPAAQPRRRPRKGA